MLRRDPLLAAPQPRLRAPVLKLFEHVFHGDSLAVKRDELRLA
jgi:hypothetical protein